MVWHWRLSWSVAFLHIAVGPAPKKMAHQQRCSHSSRPLPTDSLSGLAGISCHSCVSNLSDIRRVLQPYLLSHGSAWAVPKGLSCCRAWPLLVGPCTGAP